MVLYSFTRMVLGYTMVFGYTMVLGYVVLELMVGADGGWLETAGIGLDDARST